MRNFFSFVTSILLLSSGILACSFTIPGVSSSPQPGYRYDGLSPKLQESSAIGEYRAISAWDKSEITYAFAGGTDQLPGDTEFDVVSRAFALWDQQIPITITRVSDTSGADIVISWEVGDHGDGDPFDGPGDVLAHASFPNPYDKSQVFLHFDDDEHWVDSDRQNVDLETVAAHEIGHTLGLAHSDDPNALMFPSYSGPHRSLEQDDIGGIQEIYGASSSPAPPPGTPAPGSTPPTANGQDSDQDGLSDNEEVLVTGTDQHNPDSDGDGLVDGVEVANRMNPLDPDRDKDGVPDGQEVNQGTDPTFPEQPDVPADLENQVSDFLTRAIELQIEAYQRGDPSIAAPVLAGQEFDNLASDIASLNQQGLVSISEIDYYQSYINDIRVINDSQVDVDTCEVWTTSTYRKSDGQLVDSTDPTLLPQTITIQQQNGSWFITNVNFLNAPAFCNQ